MKKLLLALCCGLTFQSGVYALLSRDLSFDNLRIATSGATVGFGNCEQECEAGRPVVPVQVLTLILPPSADLARVTVSLRDTRIRSIAGAFRVTPGTPSVGGGALAWPTGAVRAAVSPPIRRPRATLPIPT